MNTHQNPESKDAEKMRIWIDGLPDLPQMSTYRGQDFKNNLFVYLEDLKADVRDFEKSSRGAA